jgi:hypothetical protein
MVKFLFSFSGENVVTCVLFLYAVTIIFATKNLLNTNWTPLYRKGSTYNQWRSAVEAKLGFGPLGPCSALLHMILLSAGSDGEKKHVNLCVRAKETNDP